MFSDLAAQSGLAKVFVFLCVPGGNWRPRLAVQSVSWALPGPCHKKKTIGGNPNENGQTERRTHIRTSAICGAVSKGVPYSPPGPARHQQQIFTNQAILSPGPGTAFKFEIGPGRHNRSSRLVLAPNVGWFGAHIMSRVLDVTKPYEFLKSIDSKCTRNWF